MACSIGPGRFSLVAIRFPLPRWLTRFREGPTVSSHRYIACSSGPALPMLGWETAHGETPRSGEHLAGRSCFLILGDAKPGRWTARQVTREGDAMIELLERQKRLTVNQWKLICTANLADLLDFFDLFLIGYVTAALTKE